MTPIKFVKISWVDAFSYDDAHAIDDNFEIHTVLTAGFLVKEEEDRLVICRDFFPNVNAGTLPLIRGTIAIPKKMIVEQKIIDLGD
jgi:hypothetical protein